MKNADIIVIGGGATGAATGLGLVRNHSEKILLFDEKPGIHRVSRANFGLTTYMCKGLNDTKYADWSLRASHEWAGFAKQLEDESGICVDLSLNGGGEVFLTQAEMDVRIDQTRILKEMAKARGSEYPVSILDKYEFSKLIPKMKLGEQVVGGMFVQGAGHVNPLFLLRAMRKAFVDQGGEFIPGESVMEICPRQSDIIIRTTKNEYGCKKLVVAAGHGSTRLMGTLGVNLHLYPQRGQLLVTNRMKPLLPIPLLTVRQTAEGTFMIGVSNESAGHDTRVTVAVLKDQAKKGIAVFPMLAGLKWVRCWAALRVMTPDGSPLYDTIPGHDNIFVLAGHSAISNAPLHASTIAPWIISGIKPKRIEGFGLGRFNV
ncbi:MAG: FAD-dependent oxidoreductase [Desulfobacula sp.]|jgi:glycine/D-amino acid oxidase-like deaminating enzyme|nr:FAD-dependent oxidoreductase [Desulfobacula sp.]